MKINIYSFKPYKILLLSIIALFISINLYGADFDLGKHGILSITIPDSWSVNDKPLRLAKVGLVSHDFVFKPNNGAKAKLMLTLVFIDKKEPDRVKLKNELIKSCKQFLSQSVEKKININYFSLKSGYGVYCLLTDASMVGKKTKPDEYKIMGSGLVQPNNHIFGTVSMFTDNTKSKEFKQIIEIINSMKIK